MKCTSAITSDFLNAVCWPSHWVSPFLSVISHNVILKVWRVLCAFSNPQGGGKNGTVKSLLQHWAVGLLHTCSHWAAQPSAQGEGWGWWGCQWGCLWAELHLVTSGVVGRTWLLFLRKGNLPQKLLGRHVCPFFICSRFGPTSLLQVNVDNKRITDWSSSKNFPYKFSHLPSQLMPYFPGCHSRQFWTVSAY